MPIHSAVAETAAGRTSERASVPTRPLAQPCLQHIAMRLLPERLPSGCIGAGKLQPGASPPRAGCLEECRHARGSRDPQKIARARARQSPGNGLPRPWRVAPLGAHFRKKAETCPEAQESSG